MRDRRGAGLLILLLCASCTAPSIGLRPPSSQRATESGLTVALDDPLPAGPPRLTYRVANMFNEMLSWSPLSRHSRSVNADDEATLNCLTAAVYYEARSESEEGQRAVAQVVLNRVGKPSFAGSVCGVIHQRSAASGGCQFDFVCDGAQRGRRETGAWAAALRIARRALGGETYDPVGSATFYHTTAVSPDWSRRFVRVRQIGAHIFYKSRA
jgi:spore germination cell wall hydrolase CwlJ-like protein